MSPNCNAQRRGAVKKSWQVVWQMTKNTQMKQDATWQKMNVIATQRCAMKTSAGTKKCFSISVHARGWLSSDNTNDHHQSNRSSVISTATFFLRISLNSSAMPAFHPASNAYPGPIFNCAFQKRTHRRASSFLRQTFHLHFMDLTNCREGCILAFSLIPCTWIAAGKRFFKAHV